MAFVPFFLLQILRSFLDKLFEFWFFLVFRLPLFPRRPQLAAPLVHRVSSPSAHSNFFEQGLPTFTD